MDIHPHLLAGIVIIGVLLITGTVIFHTIEGWSFVDSFYFSGMTITTIGYGDFVPTSDFSKIITVGYSILGISGMFFVGIGIFGAYFKDRQHALERRFRIRYAKQAAIEPAKTKHGKLKVRTK